MSVTAWICLFLTVSVLSLFVAWLFTREVVGSDTTWQAAAGPVLADAAPSPQQSFDGIALDLGWLARGWCRPGAVKDGWDGILKWQFDNRHMPCNFVEIMPRLKER